MSRHQLLFRPTLTKTSSLQNRLLCIAASGVVTLMAITGCAPSSSIQSYSNLVGQGLMPVSANNAYVGSNLFIAAEAERSGYLLNFLKGRGGPSAIELVANHFGPPSMLLYYPQDREVYRADLQEQRRGEVLFSEWLVRGPYAIERRDYRELAKMDGSMVSEPVFVIRGRETRFGQSATSAGTRMPTGGKNTAQQGKAEVSRNTSGTQPVIVPVVPTAKPTRKVITKKEQRIEPTPTPHGPLNSDQQALRLSRGLVERAPNGDGVHIVTSETQTVEKISEWYTGTSANAAKLATASGLTVGAQPPLASRVIIPHALMKREERLRE